MAAFELLLSCPRLAVTYRSRERLAILLVKIGQDGDRAAVIAKHEARLRNRHDLLRTITELRGKDLVCFGAVSACHGDLLLRLAKGSREEMVAWWRAARL